MTKWSQRKRMHICIVLPVIRHIVRSTPFGVLRPFLFSEMGRGGRRVEQFSCRMAPPTPLSDAGRCMTVQRNHIQQERHEGFEGKCRLKQGAGFGHTLPGQVKRLFFVHREVRVCVLIVVPAFDACDLPRVAKQPDCLVILG